MIDKNKIKKVYLDNHCFKTYEHILAVANQAKLLAQRYDVNVEKCEIAALLHDVSAIMSPDDMYKEMVKRGEKIDQAEATYHFLLHQRISRLIAEDMFEIHDCEILSAIECHTTLKKEPSIYDEIVFLADKIAWDQTGKPPYIDEVMKGLDISLEQACYNFIHFQFENQLLKMPHTWIVEAYQYLGLICKNHKIEI